MATSAFKSTSRRGSHHGSSSKSSSSSVKDQPLEDPGRKIPNRRSRSVSAVPRSQSSNAATPATLPVLEYSNKRDNPLYSSSSSPDSKNPAVVSKVNDGDALGSRRGRSVSRCSGVGNESARSLSMVGGGRLLRSVSREHLGNSESDGEHVYRSASSVRSEEDGSLPNAQRKSEETSNEFSVPEQTKNLRKLTTQQRVSESWETTSSSSAQARNWEDVISTGSFSEAEEAMIGAVCEQVKSDHPLSDAGSSEIYETVRLEVQRAVSEIRNDLENALWRKNPATTTTKNILDIPPEFDPDAVELVSEVRREYASKLEQSQERARKLRADLAVEEQREQELSRILQKMILDPKSSGTRKSRPRRKASMERLKMSRRLAEEAMNYFDECVSISTFDSSDFSSLEEPQPSSDAGIPSMGSSRFFPRGGSTFSIPDFSGGQPNHEELDNQTQCSLSMAGSDLAISSCTSGNKAANLMHSDTPRSGSFQFTFAREPMETCRVRDISHYIEKFGKGSRKENIERMNARSSYNSDDYDFRMSAESLLFEKVIVRNRIESGGLLMCSIRTFGYFQ